MYAKPLESDWRKFRKKAPEWRERYLSSKNTEFVSILTEQGKTATDQFWQLKEVLDKEAKILKSCLDGHSRSKMEMFLILMFRNGLITESDLAEFSDELRESILAIVK